MTTHKVLVGAKAYLLRHGWKQGDYGDYGGPRCLVGGVCSAMGRPIDEVEHSPAHALLCDLLDLKYGHLVPMWNDEEDRTFDEVIALLDKAILATAPDPEFAAMEVSPLHTEVVA